MIRRKKNKIIERENFQDYYDRRFWKFIPRPRLAIKVLKRIWMDDLKNNKLPEYVDNGYGEGKHIIYHEYSVTTMKWYDIHSREEYKKIFCN